MSGHARELRRIAADQEEDIKRWLERKRCPVASELRDRALVVQGMLDDPERKKEIAGLIFSLEPIIRSGRDITERDIWGPYQDEVEEMLQRAEELCR